MLVSRIMLVEKGHVGGKRSCCLWRIISFADLFFAKRTYCRHKGIPPERIEEEGHKTHPQATRTSKRGRLMMAAHEKHVSFTEWVPICPFATKIAANYMSARHRPDFMGVLGLENSSISR